MLNPRDARRLARALDATREAELGCDECFERLDSFVEKELAGLDAAEAMPLVRHHLDICGECREEYRALYDALRVTDDRIPVHLVWLRLRRLLFGD